MSGVAPARCVVLLGASNLSQGISTVVETARNVHGQPVEVLAAAGFGRSYGIDSCVLGRTLPGILHCALWEELGQRAQTPTTALITDIGNDILYEVEVPQILEWITTAIDRLQRAQAKVCVTLLPPIEPSNLSPARFRFFRTLFFPGCRLERDQVLQRTGELHDRLHQLCQTRSVTVIDQDPHWYGLDPIHIRRRHRPHAWREILSNWSDETAPQLPLARGSLARWLYLQMRSPHRRKLFGIEQRSKQPSVRLRDGTIVSFY
ncbi:MAG TPA: SGNH/GDSL hydrolase family protein [Pirellulales bacterium]